MKNGKLPSRNKLFCSFYLLVMVLSFQFFVVLFIFGIQLRGLSLTNTTDQEASEDDCNFCPSGEKAVRITGCYNPNPTNGCGSSTWSETALDIIDFLTSDEAHECCNQHDLCYEKCGTSFDECEQEFRDCLDTHILVISRVYIGELARLPLFHLWYLTSGSSGKETSKLCPFGTTENGSYS